MKRKTYVNFLKTESFIGARDGEVKVEITAQINFSKIPWIEDLSSIYKKRFPLVASDGTFIVTGKAVCGDEQFDFDKGFRIAETRAQAKAFSIASKIYWMIAKKLISLSQDVSKLSSNCSYLSETSIEHAKKIDTDTYDEI